MSTGDDIYNDDSPSLCCVRPRSDVAVVAFDPEHSREVTVASASFLPVHSED